MFVLSATNVTADVNLKFGLYLSDNPSELKKKFKPILATLEKKISAEMNEPVKIRMVFSKTYEAGINAILKGKTDFSRVGPASYVLASNINADIDVLAVEHKKGKKTFNGVIAIHKDSKVSSASELKGDSFAFGNERSTIGRYLAQSYLMNHGVKASDLSNYKYLGSHKKAGTAVGRKKYTAGALKESTFKKMIKKNVPIKALAKFPNVTKPWIARPGLNNLAKIAITNALLSITDKKVLKAIGKDGFLAGSDEDYSIIRQSMAENETFFK